MGHREPMQELGSPDSFKSYKLPAPKLSARSMSSPTCFEVFKSIAAATRPLCSPRSPGNGIARAEAKAADLSGLRLLIWTEDQQHRPVWTETAQKLRGVPMVRQFSECVTRRALAEAFTAIHGMETTPEQLRCYLLPDGGLVEDPAATLRDGDNVLLRGGLVGRGTKQRGRNVTVQVKILGLSRIDTVAQTFYADFVVVLSWLEECLVGIEEDRVDWTLVFHPALDIRNAYELEEVSTFGDKGLTRLRSSDGQVTAVHRFKGVLSQPMDLEAFPFDTQHLSICISTRGQNSKEVLLRPSDGSVVLPPDAHSSLPDWKLCKCEQVGVSTDPTHSMHGSVYTLVQVRICAVRIPTFYLTNIVAILVGIVSLCFMSFLFSQDALSERLSLNSTLLLAAVGFKTYVADALPKISLLTALDRYFVNIFGFLYLVIVENGVVLLLASCVSEQAARVTDRFCLVCCAIIFVALHVWMWATVRKAQEKAENSQVAREENAATIPSSYSSVSLDGEASPQSQIRRSLSRTLSAMRFLGHLKAGGASPMSPKSS
mmetsp:Transcript_1716/g.4272  ORF Transcript_1716/g.4272 Transcript_1716/m.4272 type:complete len:544 (-) Transcript_1716:21-1652(-)